MAGVTHSTVSRALRDSPLINRETVQRIQRIASEAGYRPSAAARSLVTRRSDTIGVVVTNIADPFVAGVVSGIEEMADQNGLSVFLANSNARTGARGPRGAQVRGAAGGRHHRHRVPCGRAVLPLFTHMQVPIVLLNNQHPSQSAHSVMIANTQASMDAVRHLIALGHRRIAYLGGPLRASVGYGAVFRLPAGAARGRIAVSSPYWWRTETASPKARRSRLPGCLRLHRPPTAIFFYNDMSALGGMRQIRNCGLRIPADVSVVGFDDLYISQYLDPPLTTVRQPMRQMGRMAMESLLQIFAGAESGHDIKVPGELIVRQSTAPPKENQ